LSLVLVSLSFSITHFLVSLFLFCSLLLVLSIGNFMNSGSSRGRDLLPPVQKSIPFSSLSLSLSLSRSLSIVAMMTNEDEQIVDVYSFFIPFSPFSRMIKMRMMTDERE